MVLWDEIKEINGLLGSSIFIYDATFPVYPGMPVYPGDPEVSFSQVMKIESHGVDVHGITMGTHTGTHIDAPAHFIRGGKTVEGIEPGILMGSSRLHDLEGIEKIEKSHLVGLKMSPRIIIKTGYLQDRPEHPFVTPEAAGYLVEMGIGLLGLDTPSPDRPDFPESHNILLEAGIVIIENMRLEHVPAGQYHLYCLPLLLLGMDGAPARVFLKKAYKQYGRTFRQYRKLSANTS